MSRCFRWLLLLACCTSGLAQESAPATSTSAPATATSVEGQPPPTPETQPASEPATTSESTPALKKLTLSAIYGPVGRVDFDGSYERGMQWLADGAGYLVRRGEQLKRVDALTGDVSDDTVELDLAAALTDTCDFDSGTSARLARDAQRWTADRSAALVRRENVAYVWRVGMKRALTVPLPEGARVLDLSPRGDWVSYARDNNLFAANATTRKERPLTRDGSPTLLNGVLDWVYQEEIYGRGTWRGYWWSSDDQYIAFLQLDEARVPTYPVMNSTKARPTPEITHYPKAGDPNPAVRVGIARVADGRVVWADLSAYAGQEILIVQVSWSPDGRAIISVQDREQRWMDVLDVDPRDGRSRILLRERSPAWVENFAAPQWLPDGSILWLSDRDGQRHLYHHARDGSLICRLTGGEWSIDKLIGSDAAGRWAYFTAWRDSPVQRHAYRVPVAGGPIERLTELGFSHAVDFDPTCTFFFDRSSTINTPPRVHLRRADGALVRVISPNESRELDEYAVRPAELLRVPARDGRLLNAMLFRPYDFDPARKYPVWVKVYAGPSSKTVEDDWSMRGYLVDQYLAQLGMLVWRIDPRSASSESPISAWQAWRRLGEPELADIEDSLRWLIDQGYADPDRIGIQGHSYGGFMTAYALTHSKLFCCGIAGAPVTDWRNYDTIYTERYMRTPANNSAGYDDTSVWKSAENLHGRLLLAHGLLDDNVHFQNSAELIRELHKNRKQFDLMVYPLDEHGFGNGDRHWRDMQFEFIRRWMLGE